MAKWSMKELEKACDLASKYAQTGYYEDERALENYARAHDIALCFCEGFVGVEDESFPYTFEK